ncbi:uncharacterized protein LOC126252290 [Schistocerca nitens]|uniref:uncharacterized protein LOC126252290 n=1 Tax=Schistocerca nitens TaxID=7011 RepID=UPI002119B3B4|nr:uncharacterized protein LOC126252290 [Schistocerca nitens]
MGKEEEEKGGRALGDPLIKGLKEIADKRPQDPVTYLATYLFNAANNHKSIGNMQENNRLIAPPPPAKGRLEAAPIPSDMDPQEADIEEVPETPENSAIDRDEHGQSMLHFAAARAHGRNGLFQLLQETGLNAGYRDELYRTARDVAIQANIPDNIHDIDKWVLHLAANGEREKLMELLLEGYDHILDVENDDGLSIIEVVAQSEQPETLQFLQSISDFEERREELHNAVRQGNLLRVRELLEADDAELLAIAKNIYGRSSLHIAVLCQDEEITQFLTDRFPTTLKTGDNLERTALHYAMGVEKVEELSTFLIRAGARRIAKDLHDVPVPDWPVCQKATVEGGQELGNIMTTGAQETYWVTNDDGVGFEEICRVLENSGNEDVADMEPDAAVFCWLLPSLAESNATFAFVMEM